MKKTKLFHSTGLPRYTIIGIFGMKINHLATLVGQPAGSFVKPPTKYIHTYLQRAQGDQMSVRKKSPNKCGPANIYFDKLNSYLLLWKR
jgi:hypothetical protein